MNYDDDAIAALGTLTTMGCDEHMIGPAVHQIPVFITTVPGIGGSLGPIHPAGTQTLKTAGVVLGNSKVMLRNRYAHRRDFPLARRQILRQGGCGISCSSRQRIVVVAGSCALTKIVRLVQVRRRRLPECVSQLVDAICQESLDVLRGIGACSAGQQITAQLGVADPPERR